MTQEEIAEVTTEIQLIQVKMQETLKAFQGKQFLSRYVALIGLAGSVAVQAILTAPPEDRVLLAAQYAARLLALGDVLVKLPIAEGTAVANG